MKRPNPKIAKRTATNFRVFTSPSLLWKLLREIIRCGRTCQGENAGEFGFSDGKFEKFFLPEAGPVRKTVGTEFSGMIFLGRIRGVC
jgi:hypothetical protein